MKTASVLRSLFHLQVDQMFLAPEVIQLASIDCGPAALKSLLEGIRVQVDYGHLRELCQTSIDGTSIAALVQVMRQLGVDAELVIVPKDYLLIRPEFYMPAIIMTQLPMSGKHFQILWSKFGSWVQKMDPGSGRDWSRPREALRHLYVHTLQVPATDWREWVDTQEFQAIQRTRIQVLGGLPAEAKRLLSRCLEDPSWKSAAILDATLRMVASYKNEKLISKPVIRNGLIQEIFEEACARNAKEVIPHRYWSVSEAPAGELRVSGTLAVRVLGKLTEEQRQEEIRKQTQEDAEKLAKDPKQGPPSVELAPPPEVHLSATLTERLREIPILPTQEVLKRSNRGDLQLFGLMFPATFLVAVGGFLRLFLMKQLLDLDQVLKSPQQKATALVFFTFFILLSLGMDLFIRLIQQRLGRNLEAKIRTEMLYKLPRINDVYFSSRPVSDVIGRCESASSFGSFPQMFLSSFKGLIDFALVVIGIIWLSPGSWVAIAVIFGLSTFSTGATGAWLAEKSMKVQLASTALMGYYSNTLRGLMVIRAHTAEQAIRYEYEKQLQTWKAGFKELQKTQFIYSTLQSNVFVGITAWVLYQYMSHALSTAGSLLLIYWITALPGMVHGVTGILAQYQGQKTNFKRIFELLNSPSESQNPGLQEVSAEAAPGVTVEFKDVDLVLSGKTILRNIQLVIPAGQHVAIVGGSGSGKSSWIGALLGIYTPHRGEMLWNQKPYDRQNISLYREQTVWIDPDIRLWNDSMMGNLRYGYSSESTVPVSEVMQATELGYLVEKFTDGYDEFLGEAGCRISGGEGQRVRFARSRFRENARLVLLDEALRGLPRDQRYRILKDARDYWKQATLLCVTHDIRESSQFDRVLVFEKGKIIEDGKPADLLAQKDSTYAQLYNEEVKQDAEVWTGSTWKRWRLEDGRIIEQEAS